VIQARFSDAAFFINEDSRHSMEDFVKRESTLVFHPKLGSMLDKTNRIVKLTESLAADLHLDSADTKTAGRRQILQGRPGQ
jgi:glycyl-tRNA synthetase beta subunit